ncbi:outer membrane protein assembly factor BamD [Palleronia caenipelagi]|uniref:Outer membrane protein assembly factor BamD n=1 Tax=Palleronia caenipelagi TaxID=2489174 RepID=A0A547QAU9_9RHOB|nr:outer membrane protein assembly factor BamD [Palleronia caenipelagi]TRD23466.1 outer membrane protein assembly factor BamD [Palleronia caenipelagi]
MAGFSGRLICVIALSIAVTGCGRFGLPGGDQEAPLESLDAASIYQRAELELETNNPERAATYFGEVERLYPYSEWGRRALVMQALSYHRDGDYESARGSAQRYLEFYPTGEDAAYAQYLLALSYYDQIDDVGRDQGLTFQALQALREVIELHPDTEYARSSVLKFDLAFDHLAGKEMEIGRYYLKRRHYAAAIKRFRVVVEDFQTTTHTPEALLRLVEAYLSLGLVNEARTAGAILGYNYRSTPWYQDAYALLTGRGLTLEPAGESWLTVIYRQVIRGEWL